MYVPRFPQPNFDTVFSDNVLLCCTERIACSRAGAEQWANNPAELDRSHSHLDPSKKMYTINYYLLYIGLKPEESKKFRSSQVWPGDPNMPIPI